LVPWDSTAFIALVDDANDLPILYYFRKGSRPYAAVGCLGLLARCCAASIDLSRLLLLLVVIAMSTTAFALAMSSWIFCLFFEV